jgi:hypothetical protein
MAKQSFVTGQVLTAAQLTSLQQTAMSGGAASAKTANYTLVASDAGTAISMTSTSATTITVNTGLFAAGDTVFIQNLGTGLCTITAGTATVDTAGSLILPQYDAGILYFVSASSAVFYDYIQVGAASPLTTKGDLYTFGSSDTRIGVGANDTVLTADSSTATGLKWAAPASSSLTWTQRKSGSSNSMTKIAYNGTDLYVAVGSAGGLFTSPDGITWTSRTSGFGANAINCVAFGNSLWVAVGGNGTITTSTDGTTWTARTANFATQTINDVIYANSTWVAVGNGGGTANTGGITYSTDGITWTRKNQSITVGSGYRCVVWNGTNFIIGSNTSTNNYLYASTAAGTWTAGFTGNSGAVEWIVWDGTRHTFYDGALGITTSTIFASPTFADNFTTPAPNVKNVVLYDNKIWGNYVYFANFEPTSTAFPNNPKILGIAPSTYANGDISQVPGLTAVYGCLFVGAIGYMIADQSGRIYTSF